jgi:hypothetical protein
LGPRTPARPHTRAHIRAHLRADTRTPAQPPDLPYGMMTSLRAFLAVCVLAVAGALGFSSSAAAATCPTATYLDYNHLAYAEVSIPAGVQLASGRAEGSGAIDEATTANGCKRARHTVQVLSAGSVDPHVAVVVSGRPGTAFVIGQRCAGFTGSAYWDCLTQPLVWDAVQYTATSYPSQPAPAKTLALGAAIGTADYHGRRVTIRRIQGVDPALAVGVSGQPSVAWLSPLTCPYSGFSNTPQYDNLLRCLHSPVWFTFDPPGDAAGDTVVGRADRPVAGAVAGATISLALLSVDADYVPANPKLVRVGDVASAVSLKLPHVSAGLYEAVVSCPQCSAAGASSSGLYPAGSVLVSAPSKSSTSALIVNYVLVALVLIAVALGYRARRRRRALGLSRPGFDIGKQLSSILIGPGPAGSARRRRGWDEDAPARGRPADAAARPEAPAAPSPPASRPAKRKTRSGRKGKSGGARGKKPGAG